MDCPRNALGQKLCNVVEHPDRLGESFCATCNKRFQDSRSSLSPEFSSNQDRQLPSPIVDIITGVLALFLAAVVNGFAKNAELQLPPPQTEAAHATFLTASEKTMKYSEII
ncbi:MAG: hypothetical protein HC827_13335 [Cyanobacteria bacterium RM1_2_2]|nr:hypothetical protein [Cyanobacteria bacterium RM1_2_2]